MSSSSRRAAIACTFCRQRKRKCDGNMPQCETCYGKGLECSYTEPEPQRYNDSPDVRSHLQRLDAVENIIQEHSASIGDLERQFDVLLDSIPQSNLVQGLPITSERRIRVSREGRCSSDETLGNIDTTPPQREDDSPPITIPLRHQTSTSTLLMLPQVARLVGAYPEEFFFRVENKRPRSVVLQSVVAASNEPSNQGLLVNRSEGDKNLQCFLDVVHPFHPFLDKTELIVQYEETMSRGFDSGSQAALIMAVLALGVVASDPAGRRQERQRGDPISAAINPVGYAEAVSETDRMGDRFIRQALQILFSTWTACFHGDVLISQALLVCALYFNYIIDPLMAWRLVHMASTNMQQVLNRCQDLLLKDSQLQNLTRLSWVSFTLECDLLAEFHQPRSGIELLVDKLPFPDYGESPCPENLYVLAEISARLLMNRIHHALFPADNLAVYTRGVAAVPSRHRRHSVHSPNASLLRVCDELDRQLQTWYDSLPEVIRPDISGAGNSGNRHASMLELRYWSTKQNIYRNFVIDVTSDSAKDFDEVPMSVLKKCSVCLDACRSYILAAGCILSGPTPYTYLVAQYCLNSALVLSIAAHSNALESLVSDIDLDLERTVNLLEHWAKLDFGIKPIYEIAYMLASKQRFEI